MGVIDHTHDVGGGSARTAASRPPAGGLSRRLFLKRSATVLVSGLVASRLGAVERALAHEAGAQAPPHLSIWAATRSGDRYLALAGSGEDPAIRELDVDDRGGVTLGSTLGVSLPDGFAALALLAAGDRLLVGGGALEEIDRLTIDYRADEVHPDDREPSAEDWPQGVETVPVFTLRPALYEVVDGAVKELPLGSHVMVAYGAVTAIAASSGQRLAVTIEGSDDVERACNDVTRVAESADGGQTWSAGVLASGLGEGLGSHLAATAARTLAVTVDAAGGRTFHERTPGRGWQPAPGDGSQGPVLALVAAGPDTVDLFDRSPGGVQRKRREGAAPAWQHAGGLDVGEDVLTLVAVSGGRGEVIAVGESGAHLVS